MDAQFWHQRWADGQIGFHEAAPHPLLLRYWPQLGLAPGARVLVPLCGKSHDLTWLADSGCHVVGVELSELAVAAYFDDNGITPEITTVGGMQRYSSEGISLWCGDFFAFEPAMAGHVDAVYDRAALIALPPPMRRDYCAHLSALMPAAARQLLITVEYDEHEVNPPPFVVAPDEVRAQYAGRWRINQLDSCAADIKGAAGTEHVFSLIRETDNGHG